MVTKFGFSSNSSSSSFIILGSAMSLQEAHKIGAVTEMGGYYDENPDLPKDISVIYNDYSKPNERYLIGYVIDKGSDTTDLDTDIDLTTLVKKAETIKKFTKKEVKLLCKTVSS